MNKKLIIGFVVFLALIIGGGVVFSGNQPTKADLEKTQGAKVQIQESSFDFKDVKYSGGNVKHGFKIKNMGTKDLTIANMATSCMCTTVSFQTEKVKSPEFGMKGHSSESNWIGMLKPQEEAQIVANFDPTAHGPQGVGFISRVVSFETNDPDKPYIEFSFSGTVVK